MTALFSQDLKATARKMRREFEVSMANERHANRFAWDWFHVPGRYTHLRTPAAEFFSPALFTRFEQELTQYGRRVLGCSQLSPVWLSNYVEGCEQRLHADRPHGPWAFVLPLTPSGPRRFQGGETLLLQNAVLSLWNQTHGLGQPFEEPDIVRRIAPVSGRLLVFDPRIPHGVSRVSGTVDPLQGRLVLHGWFTQPSPVAEGGLKARVAEVALRAFDRELEKFLAHTEVSGFLVRGTAAYRLEITPAGRVRRCSPLAHSLRCGDWRADSRQHRQLSALVRQFFTSYQFPKMKTTAWLTLPLTLDTGSQA